MPTDLRGVRRGLAALAAAVLVAGCAVTQVETADPAAVPTGTIAPLGPEATGDIVELGSGVALDRGWRFSMYPSDDGWCTQLEMVAVASTACGDPLPHGDAAFGSIGQGDLGGIQNVKGVVTADTATVWLVGEDNVRAPATLMSLERAGLEQRAFVGFAPADVSLTHLQAVKANGDVLETYELP
jgi:hypothetical protein